eukprot:TRINITY_DN45998_c0_g1_i1.p1 TRINITY_DN45998_c0_g1~~TRINITY_DN45998_c0_g1_i1.p1  ORF type:complete len:240 (-),score=25.61 TRINITY_DN45998_c0_g1_i1:55-774(-)
MLVSSFAPTESWADFVRDVPPIPPARHNPPMPACEPATRPNPAPDPSSGSLGPGSYCFSEALVRKASPCPKFLRSARFQAPPADLSSMSSMQDPSCSTSLLDASSSSPVWRSSGTREGASMSGQRRGGGRCASEPKMVSRVRLGRACVNASASLGGSASRDFDVTVRSDIVSKRVLIAEESSSFGQSTVRSRPPVMGHPRGKGGTVRLSRDASAQDLREIHLFGGSAPFVKNRLSSTML